MVAARLFLCYAREDHKWAELLRSHLRPLEDANYISAFFDRELEPGAAWDSAIRTELEMADLIVPLVSIDLLNSRYAVQVELRSALERSRAGSVRIVPVIADYCDWEPTPLGELQALPTGSDGRIMPLVDWSNANVPLTAVVKKLRTVLGEPLKASRMPSPPPDRPRSPAEAPARPQAQPGFDPQADTRTVSIRSFEMLDLAFASATALLQRSAAPSMWVDELHQKITMTVRVDGDWSVRYEKETEMTVNGAGAIMAAPFKITAQADVMSRLSLFDVDARYVEIDSDMQPLMFPASIRGPERGFAVVFAPPITTARARRFRAWFAVDREFAATLGTGQSDHLTCATNQLAHIHRAELTFRVVVSAKLPPLDLQPQFDCVRVKEGTPTSGLGEPYVIYEYQAEAQPVLTKLKQKIDLRKA